MGWLSRRRRDPSAAQADRAETQDLLTRLMGEVPAQSDPTEAPEPGPTGEPDLSIDPVVDKDDKHIGDVAGAASVAPAGASGSGTHDYAAVEGKRSDRPTVSTEDNTMALDNSIQQLLGIDGAIGAAIIDSESGMALAQGGSPGFDLGVAAAGNSNVVRAKLATMKEIGLEGKIDDILITLDAQYHLINVLNTPSTRGLFIYLVLDRSRANLALARHRLRAIAPGVEI